MKRWSRGVQIAMGVGVAAMVPILWFGMPDSAPIQVGDLTMATPKDPEPAPSGPADNRGIDAMGVSARLGQIGNAPKPKPPDENPATPTEPTQTAAASPLRFLGAVYTPAGPAALMVVQERQRMLWVGDSAGDVQIADVTDDHVTIRQAGAERRIDRAPRTGPSVTAAAASVGSPGSGAESIQGNTAGVVDATQGDQPGMSPEQAAQRREMLERMRRRGAEERTVPR